jgi:1,4-alpha-glucan branching enzyme/maltooligosyltrehalose trehalohydrolase
MPFGAELLDHGVRFAVWAPAAREARVHVDGVTLPMKRAQDGFFRIVAEHAAAGSRYAFSFDGSDLHVPDPASRFNPEDVHRPSEVIDPKSFDWPDDGWRSRPWHEAVIYELHVGTFTPEGTYAAAEQKLDYLAKLGITAIELMPLADAPGRCNWGYDGVLQFAPEHGFGRPEELKRFVASAHARGIMVLLDVVYNHFGPDGNYLHLYAPQFFTPRHHTPWGNAINFDDDRADVVRSFFVHNALYWLEEYRFDGLRLDAVHSILDDSEPDFLSELAAAADRLRADREVHLVLENDRNAAHYLERRPNGKPAAYTAQWNDDFHHALHVLLTDERGGHYQDYEQPAANLLKALREGFVFQGETSRYRGGERRGEPSAGLPLDAFVNFLQNHDQIGNRPDGKRLWMLVGRERMLAAETLLLLTPSAIMLFMGDEFRAPTLFPFFCDFTGDLAAAVTEGRRRELEKLDPEGIGSRLPPPNTWEARNAAVIEWSALVGPEHHAALERHRQLLAVRREVLWPRWPPQSSRGELLAERALSAEWRLADGARLTLAANLDDRPLEAAAPLAGKILASTHDDGEPHREWPRWYVAWALEP